jgi:hypothetical protein
MHVSDIFSNRQFRGAAIFVGVFTLILLLINLFLIGGDFFVFSFNSSINAPLAIIITIAAGLAWHQMGIEKRRRRLWAGLLVGWALWALAEVIYALYSILGQEAPYPSVADIFWLVGYIPLGLGLLVRIRRIPTKPTRSQALIIAGVTTATIFIAAIFVFLPTFQSFDPSQLFESLLNLAYPLADCVLLIIVWRLFFTYEKGAYGFGWRLLALGFISLTIADLVYLYANSTDPILYYPDLRANFISRFGSDVPYSLSYLFWMLGIFALRIPPQKEQQPVAAAIALKRPQKYGHILVFTKSDDSVIDVSSNFGRLFATPQIKGRSLATLLHISEQASLSICDKVHTGKKVADLPLHIPDSLLGPLDASLCGTAIFDNEGKRSGMNLLLMIPTEIESFDAPLSLENKAIVKRLLDQTGSDYKKEIGPFLLVYHLPYLQAMMKATLSQGGPQMAQELLEELKNTSREHHWQMQFNPETVLENADYPLDVLRQALPALLGTAKRFVTRITDTITVKTMIQEMDARFDDAVHKDIELYGKPD